MGGSSGDGKQTTTVKPPKWLEPYLKETAGEAQRLYRAEGPRFFPGQTYVDFSPQTESALQLLEQRARGGSDLLRASQATILGTARGDYLNGNPYLDTAFERGANQVQNRLGASFAGGNRLGSGAYANAYGSALGNLANDVYGQNYQAERGRQLQAAQLAPQLAQQDYFDLQQLGQVGGAREDLARQKLQDEIARFTYGEELPYRKLSDYVQLLNNNPASRYTTTVQQGGGGGGSPLLGAAGGALSGAATGALLGSVVPGIGTAIGALGGGLLGGGLGFFGGQ